MLLGGVAHESQDVAKKEIVEHSSVRFNFYIYFYSLRKSTIEFKDLSDNEIISHHLDLLHEVDPRTIVFSSLTAALRDARQATGRDVNSGENKNKENNPSASNWLGATCYLIILEQLGKCYKGRNDPDQSGLSPIQKCLRNHTQLTPDQCDAIYALRNAFAHDYSISNLNQKYSSLQHHFTLLDYYSDPFLCLPKKQWDGKPETKAYENMTHVGLPWIGEFVEKIYQTHLELHKINELEVVLPGGAKEIQNRYLLFSYKH